MNKEDEFQEVGIEEVFSEVPTCAQKTNILPYHEGLLKDPDRLSFEKHLRDCFQCAEELIQLHQAEEANQESAIDPEKSEKTFEEIRFRLRAHLDTTYQQSKIQRVTYGHRQPTFLYFPPYLNAILLVLIAALIYPAYRGLVLRQEMNLMERRASAEIKQQTSNTGQKHHEFNTEKAKPAEPEISPTNLYSFRPERDGKSNMIEIRFDRSQNIFPLIFTLPAAEFESYEIGVFRNGQPIWQTAYSNHLHSRLLSLQILRGYFDNGTYLMRVEGKWKKGSSLLAEYILRISQQ